MRYHNGQDLDAAAAPARPPANVPSYDIFKRQTLLVYNAIKS